MKVFGIGLYKTGTKTLGKCFETLGLTPRTSNNRELREWLGKRERKSMIPGKRSYDPRAGVVYEPAAVQASIDFARDFVAFEDGPWYMLFRQLDQAFPGSRFILTTRTDSHTHAVSDWYQNVKTGHVQGSPPAEYLVDMATRYEAHNAAVLDYFEGRDDLLEVCWERGDGWAELCGFLDLPVPDRPFPHVNRGIYRT